MNKQLFNYRYLINKITERLVVFLDDELVIKTIQAFYDLDSIQLMELRYLTSLINIDGVVKVFVVFSYSESLFNEIFIRYTDGLSIKDSEKEEAMMDSAGDIINIIVGNTLADIEEPNKKITISPPLVITAAKQVACQRGSLLYKANLDTEYGDLDIYVISNTIGEKL